MKLLKPLKTLDFQSDRRGSIPLQAVDCENSPTLKDAGNHEFMRFVAFFILSEIDLFWYEKFEGTFEGTT